MLVPLISKAILYGFFTDLVAPIIFVTMFRRFQFQLLEIEPVISQHRVITQRRTKLNTVVVRKKCVPQIRK